MTKPATTPAAARDPRSVAASDYPVGAGPRDRIGFLLNYAVLAPSSHNTQPWLFRLANTHVDVLADRRRALPVADPDDRELVMSCGAAIETLVVAMRRFGHLGEVQLLPEDDDPDLLARVHLEGSYTPTRLDLAMFDAIPVRRTLREPFEASPVPAAARADIAEACAQFGIDLVLADDEATKADLAALVAEGDRLQLADPRFRRELAQWMHARRRGDGMSAEGFGMPDVLTGVAALAIRTFDMGDSRAAADEAIARGSPLLAVLLTPADGTADWLTTGRALAALLLTATAHGLAASFLNQPVEVPELRNRLAERVMPSRQPQLILRLGSPAGEARRPHSQRRPLDEVLL